MGRSNCVRSLMRFWESPKESRKNWIVPCRALERCFYDRIVAKVNEDWVKKNRRIYIFITYDVHTTFLHSYAQWLRSTFNYWGSRCFDSGGLEAHGLRHLLYGSPKCCVMSRTWRGLSKRSRFLSPASFKAADSGLQRSIQRCTVCHALWGEAVGE